MAVSRGWPAPSLLRPGPSPERDPCICAGAPAWFVLAIVAGTSALSVAGHVLYALAFFTERVAAAYTRARRGIEAALGVFFGLAGPKLLASRA